MIMKKIRRFFFTSAVCVLLSMTVTQKRSDITWDPHPDPSPSEAMSALDFWTAQRAYPQKTIPDDGFYKAYEFTNKRLKKGEKNLNAEDTWTSIGPANRGGRTIAMAVDPQNPDVIYAGAASGGLWRLTMQSSSYMWEYIDTGFPVLGVNAIAIDPNHSDIIYIGTGEVYGYQNSDGGLYVRTTRGSYGIGLLKTTDGGDTWTKSIDWSYHQQRGILCIRINPLNSDVIYAGTTEGTYKSNDGGQTWEQVHSALMTVDIAIDPEDTNIVYISCGNFASNDYGIYRSMESGNPGTWTKIDLELPSFWDGKTMLAIYRASPNIIYADVANAFNTIGLYRSTDYGDHWTLLTNKDYAWYQGWFAHYIRVNPVDNNKILCAGVNFFMSTDGGRNLRSIGGMHVDHHAYADHPTDPNIIYFGNDGGVYRTLDGGYTFHELNDGYVTAQFYNGFSSSATDPNLALGGLQDNGTIMYQGTQQWRNWVLGGDGAFTGINTENDSIMYGSSQNLNLYRSSDRGNTWYNIAGQFKDRPVCFIAPYVLSPSHPWILYAGKDLIYRSEDDGENWTPTNEDRALNYYAILSIGVSHTNPDVVYAATVPTTYHRAEVFASTDGGDNWTNMTGSLPDRYYVDLQVSPHDDRVVYATLSGFGSSHLFRTEDGGESWLDIGNGLPDVPTPAVIIDPEDYNHIYVGNDLGVYVSTDYGESWTEFKEGMPTAVLVMDLSISPSNRKLRAVTHGNGVFERTLLASTSVPDDGSTDRIVTAELHQNYPNPFNPSTQIAFTLSKPSYVTLKIYNTKGQMIRTLIANGYPAGRFTVQWAGKDNHGRPVPGGVYMVRLKTNHYTLTKKMTLIR